MSLLTSTAYITAAGFCFMLANLVMKTMGEMPVYILYPAVAAAFAAGGYAVTFILVCELLFSILIAFLFLKESYSFSNLMGIGLVMVGIMLLHLPGKTISPPQEMAARQEHR